MAYNAEDKLIKDGNNEKKEFVVTFTNGTLEQLEELKEFFETPDKLGVIKLGISVLQKAKESHNHKPTSSQ